MLHRSTTGAAAAGALAIALAATLGATANGLAAQEPARYRPQSDTLWYQLSNPFHLYWVSADGDTVGDPSRNVAVESHRWLPGRPLRVEVTTQDLDLVRAVEVDTFEVTAQGRVVRIQGPGDRPSGRYDFVAPLPPTPAALEVGLEWSDSIAREWQDDGSANHYRVTRRLRVERFVDTLGARVADIRSTGIVEFRQSFEDASPGGARWLDTRGESRETFLFDVTHGRFVGRTWSMHLRGTGTLSNEAGGVDTVAAGLVSGEDLHLLPAEDARLLGRALPGTDSSYTLDASATVLLHTVDVQADTIESGLARADGMVGTATAAYDGGIPIGFSVTWTSLTQPPTRLDARVEDATIRIDGRDDVAVPDWVDAWAIADYGMDELLVPALRQVPPIGEWFGLGVYRPFADRWDEADVMVLPADDAFVAVIQFDGEDDPSVMIFNDQGDLLLTERETADGVSQRSPSIASRLRPQIERILRRLQDRPNLQG